MHSTKGKMPLLGLESMADQGALASPQKATDMESGEDVQLAATKGNLISLLTTQHEFSDVVLVVEGKKLYSSRYLLSLVSPVFHAMFTGDFVERACSEIDLPGKKYEDILDMLLQIHPSIRTIAPAEKALRLFPLFNEYQMEEEKKRCLESVLAELKNREIGRMDLQSAGFHRSCVENACVYELVDLYKACVDIAIDFPATHFDALIHNMADTSPVCRMIFAAKLKRTAYEHRNKRTFRNRLYRACEAYCDPANCVDYVAGAAEKIPVGY